VSGTTIGPHDLNVREEQRVAWQDGALYKILEASEVLVGYISYDDQRGLFRVTEYLEGNDASLLPAGQRVALYRGTPGAIHRDFACTIIGRETTEETGQDDTFSFEVDGF
jgi:hypothetical protein